jgi:glycosyltransferase involved in cell wall biosynthesis
MIASTAWVTACIPTFKCTQYLRQAVMSLLRQTHPFIRVIVINDGDPDTPWPVLADIDDPRLVRFDLGENRGPYFALAIALEATPDPLFLVQDADDWSVPHRAACLLRLLQHDDTDYAFSTLGQFHDGHGGRAIPDQSLYWRPPEMRPGHEFKLRIPHHGLYRTEAIKQLGGYFGGFRFGYDELLTNLILLVGSVSWTPERLYWRRLRSHSLTRAPTTGMRSLTRRQMRLEMGEIYLRCYQDYQNFLARRISGPDLLQLLRSRILARRGVADGRRINEHSARLRDALRMQAQQSHIGAKTRGYFATADHY